MRDRIADICRGIEEEENIRILFAVENGSRAWRMDSKDSDYDIRFVFVRPIEEYISLHKPKEVIDIAFDRGGRRSKTEGSFIDIIGFDIIKFMVLLSKSNPTVIEWLTTDIVYYGRQNKILKNFALENFNQISLYHHYRSLARDNYLKYIENNKNITYKRYLQILRGIVNARYVINKKTLPPISFVEALNEMKDIMPGSITEKLHEIIAIKKSGKEKERIQQITEMDEYINAFLEDDSKAPTEKPEINIDILNTELRRIILKK